VWLAGGLYVIAQLALTRTAWGRRVTHVGGERSKFARIQWSPTSSPTKASVYAVAGLFSAIAGNGADLWTGRRRREHGQPTAG